MPKIYICLILALFIISTYSALARADQANLKIIGLSKDLETNVQAHLSPLTNQGVLTDIRFRSHIEMMVRKALKALGYYQPSITFNLVQSQRPHQKSLLIVNVIPGKPIKIAQAKVTLRGSACRDDDYLALVMQERPLKGSILNHRKYENFKNSLDKIALRKGYFDANYLKSQLQVAVPRYIAFWDIDYDSGERYCFGTVNFIGSHIREEYLQNIVPFHAGDVYSANNVAELTRRLSETGWFNSVSVIPNIDKTNIDKKVQLNGVVTARAKNTIETGFGSSTDIGPHLKARWKKSWVNNRGHSFHTMIKISAPEKNLEWTYKIPLLQNPLEQYYLIQGGVKRTHLNDTQSDASTLSVSQYWERSNNWKWATHIHWIFDHFTQGNTTNTTMLIYPGVTLDRTRSHGSLMMPSWGDSQHYSLDISNSLWGSYIDFVVIQAKNAWVQTVQERSRFIERINLGWINTKHFSKIPPNLRFFAGGDHSVRGYKYKALSPHDSAGKLTGASKLAIGSIEYQYHITGKWWGAIFVDSGSALQDLQKNPINTGVGFGVRWQSLLGPLKLDIARPIGRRQAHNVQLYIGLGPEL
ncbi:Translocation and assembly module subunit TamA [Candidatus Erwinia haradaeae]|uniref:Translocation and assembly module subunit TamA n=1 Tax=Candidatus Erwinia haradaeae TaxID=1922217 RepID=A0A451DJB8_9GAMM|nr:autotransporter assembly complex family protein [Candidatus Erwinia haradaeae]VFP86791.1 Translocation and assembly module subunit TamA [Candidatus Erwinia haradaeae]